MWSRAQRAVGGCGSALDVLDMPLAVEKVETLEGDSILEALGRESGMRSEWGTGRRRRSTEDEVESGGEGGGECWSDVIDWLYVVQENWLAMGRLSVSGGVAVR